MSLDARHAEVLERMCAEKGLSKVALMRQALRLYQLIDERHKKGEEMAFVKDGKVVPMVLLPMMNPALTS
jgi:hypothetical protein